MAKPEVTYTAGLCMGVCVPDTWPDEQVVSFAEIANPCGTAQGWHVRTDAALLNGDPVRNPCTGRTGMVHITLDA